MDPQTCTICYNASGIKSTCHGHPYSACRDCLQQHVRVSMYERLNPNITCLKAGCRRPHTASELRAAGVSQALLNELVEFQDMKALAAMPDFVRCAHGCKYGAIIESVASFMTCETCGQRTCVSHRVPFHSGMTCEEYDVKRDAQERADGHDASMKYICQRYRRCPRCREFIEKHSGCDIMRCNVEYRFSGVRLLNLGCGHTFCYRCGADYALINRDGNHHHRPDCKHYRGTGDAITAQQPPERQSLFKALRRSLRNVFS